MRGPVMTMFKSSAPKWPLLLHMGLFLAAFALTEKAHAGDVFAGVSAHEVDTPFSLKTRESGVDVQIGYRAGKIEALALIGKPAPYVFASVNTKGDTSFIAAGLSWKLGKTFYVRPGIGLALHDGPIPRSGTNGRRSDLGSRILFEPEIAVGYQLSEKAALELSWTHISNATLLSGQNPGIDMIGLRVNFGL
jgi:lipid A 3-O-deacylase